MARVTTKTGDEGYTDLLGNARVPKYHRRPEAYGTVDEATSMLGLARSGMDDPELNAVVKGFQQDLYTLMAELATGPEQYEKVNFKIRTSDVERIEALEDEFKQRVEIGNKFVIPGDSVVGATLDVARSIVRRAERHVAKLYHDNDVSNVEALRYLNRLSDVLFVLARYVEREQVDPAR